MPRVLSGPLCALPTLLRPLALPGWAWHCRGVRHGQHDSPPRPGGGRGQVIGTELQYQSRSAPRPFSYTCTLCFSELVPTGFPNMK